MSSRVERSRCFACPLRPPSACGFWGVRRSVRRVLSATARCQNRRAADRCGSVSPNPKFGRTRTLRPTGPAAATHPGRQSAKAAHWPASLLKEPGSRVSRNGLADARCSRRIPAAPDPAATGRPTRSSRSSKDRDYLVLVLPIFELGPWASEDDPLAGDAPRADLAGVEVLDDVRRDQRGEQEDADGRVRVVADLVRALLAAWERDDVALAQLLLALVRAQRRLAAEDDRPFLVRVVGVKWPLLVTRLDLVHARADQLGVGVRADPGVLEAPALALFRAIPLVFVEIEDLHAATLAGRWTLSLEARPASFRASA